MVSTAIKPLDSFEGDTIQLRQFFYGKERGIGVVVTMPCTVRGSPQVSHRESIHLTKHEASQLAIRLTQWLLEVDDVVGVEYEE